MTKFPGLTRLTIVLLALLGIGTVLGFLVIPAGESLPIHWNINGVADGFAPAPVALLLPGVMGLIIVLLLSVMRPMAKRDYEAGRHAIEAAVNVVLGLALILLAATIAFGLGVTVNMPRLIAAALGVMLLVLGNYLPKTQPNTLAGIRLPWTMQDSANWRVTHRWTGRLMMVGGLVALLAALVDPVPPLLLTIVMGAVFLPVVAGMAISYRVSRQ